MAFEMTRGKVPHFSMRPHPVVLAAMIMTLIIGGLLALSLFSKDEGTGGTYHQQGVLTLIITAILTILQAIVATAKLWYTHLWKKNSTHARHKQHTKFHPSMREQEFRNARKSNRR